MTQSQNHKTLQNVKRMAGFFATDLEPGQYGWILIKAFVHSGQEDFHLYINQISNAYLKGYFLDTLSSFLVIIHDDRSADVYINENVPAKVLCMAKGDIQKGQTVTKSDIADIVELRFDGIEIKETDCVIYCFKKEWKFGLFFDFTASRGNQLDVEALYGDLGTYYRYLSFEKIYRAFEYPTTLDQMREDGWFPFIQLVSGDFETLSTFYKDKDKFAGNIERFVSGFDEGRINSFINHWWSNDVFEDKQQIIESGIKDYLEGNYIACIHTLYPQIEGIFQISYAKEKKPKKYVKLGELVDYVKEKAKTKFVTKDSLGFPDAFIDYLKEVVFKDFDLRVDQIDLSRGSVVHGVTKPEYCTKMRALQAILILDQIYRYLN